jgi:GDP-D-mannose dehydratase
LVSAGIQCRHQLVPILRVRLQHDETAASSTRYLARYRVRFNKHHYILKLGRRNPACDALLGGRGPIEQGRIPARNGSVSRILARSTRKNIEPQVDPKLLRPTDEPIIWGDCTKMKLATGWQQGISLDQTIDDMLAYWRQKPDTALEV